MAATGLKTVMTTQNTKSPTDNVAIPVVQIFIVSAGVLFLWAYWPAIQSTVADWGSNPDYSHGYFVVPLVVYLLWSRLDARPRVTGIQWTGLILIAVAGIVRYLSARYYLPRLEGWSIPLWISGVTWLFGGWPLFRWSLPCVALLWFMFPLPATLESMMGLRLQKIATSLSTDILQILGQPALAEGTTILLGNQTLDVERACSGLRICYGIAALACAGILYLRTDWKKSLVLIGAILPVSLAANAIRVTMTGLLYRHASGEVARKFSHDISGFVMIPIAALLLLAVLWIADRLILRLERDRGKITVTLSKWGLATAVVCAALFVWHGRQENRAVASLLAQAEEMEAEEKWGKAARYLDRYYREHPENVEVLLRLADVLAASDQKERELEVIQRAGTLKGSDSDLAARQARILLDLRRNGEAYEFASERLSSLPDDPKWNEARSDLIYVKANSMVRELVQNGERNEFTWANACRVIESAIQIRSHECGLYVQLAEVLRTKRDDLPETDRIDAADEAMEQMVAVNGDDPMAWLSRYHYQQRHNRTEDSPPHAKTAGADLDKAIELASRNSDNETVAATSRFAVFMAAGKRAAGLDKPLEAEAFYLRAIEAMPDNPAAYVDLATTYGKSGSDDGYQKIVDCLAKGLPLTNNSPFLRVLLADSLVQLERFDESSQQLAEIEKRLPFIREPLRGVLSLSVAMVRANEASARGDYGLAISTLSLHPSLATAKTPTDELASRVARVWFRLGQLYMATAAYDQAANAFSRSGELDPSLPGWESDLASALIQCGDVQRAAEYMRREFAENPTSIECAIRLARAEFDLQMRRVPELRNWSKLQSVVEQVSQLKGSDRPELYLFAADYLQATKDTEAATDYLRQKVELHPEMTLLWRPIALGLAQDGERAAALEAFAKAAPSFDNSNESEVFRAEVLTTVGAIDEALTILQTLLSEIQPLTTTSTVDISDVRRRLAVLHWRQGNSDEALALLEAIANDDETQTVSALDLACRIAWSQSGFEQLEKYEQKLAAFEGSEGCVWRAWRARRLLRGGSEDLAEIKELERQIATRRPNWHERHLLTGLIAQRERDFENAALAFQRAQAMGSKSLELAQAHVAVLSELGRFADAERHLELYQSLVDHSAFLSSLAIPVYVEQGNVARARAIAEDLVRRRPTAGSYFQLGQTLLLSTPPDAPQSEFDKVEEAFKSAIELEPTNGRWWSALYRYYVNRTDNLDSQALSQLKAFAETVDLDAGRRLLTLSQLSQIARQPYHATNYLLDALGETNDENRSEILVHAVRYFAPRNEQLTEKYARQALQFDSSSPFVKLVLAQILIDRGELSDLDEASTLLREFETTSNRALRNTALRLQAFLLLRRSEPTDEQQAFAIYQQLANDSRTVTVQDRLALAELYEKQGRTLPALELYRLVGESPDASLSLRLRYVDFLRRNEATESQFGRQADRIVAELEANPRFAVSMLRRRLQKLRDDADQVGPVDDEVDRIVNEFAQRHWAGEPTADNVSSVGLIMQLIQNDFVDAAVRFASDPPEALDKATLASQLAISLGIAHTPKQTVNQAIPVIEAALQGSPRDPTLLYSAGTLRYLQGESEDAAKLLQRCVDVQSDNVDAINNLALAVAATVDGFDRALQIIDTAIAIDSSSNSLDTKGAILLQHERYERARRVLEEARAVSPSPFVLMHLSAAYSELGDADRAREAFRRAVILNVQEQLTMESDRKLFQRLGKTYLRN